MCREEEPARKTQKQQPERWRSRKKEHASWKLGKVFRKEEETLSVVMANRVKWHRKAKQEARRFAGSGN